MGMDRPGLSEREAAVIEAARRELAARAAPRPASTPAPPPAQPQAQARQIAPETVPPGPAAAGPDVTARIAALMSTEQEERQQRSKRLRQIGIAIPAAVLAVAIVWVASVILRYLRF